MTKEELTKKLFSYNKNKVKLDLNQNKLKELTYKVTQSYSDMPASSDINSKNENYILKKENYEENIKKLEEDINIIDMAMVPLKKNETELITLRYLEGYDPVVVYNDFLHISKSTFWRHEKRVIKNMLDTINI